MFKRNPARILGVIAAALALAVGFGLKISGEQVDLIMILAAAVIPLMAGEATRSQVVSIAVADKQIEIAKASDISRPTEQIIKEAKESL
jgi:hypothetical protein